MNIFCITDQDVEDQLRNINPSKPPGPDDISPQILKNIIPSIIRPLTKLFNLSLSNKQLPHVWKVSNITPVYKNKGNPEEPGNYRPIALTSILCKIMEKIIFKYLYNYMLEHILLSKNQSGFQPRDSTVNQLLEIYNTIISNLDQGKDVRFIFCDISKAFDKV